MNNEYERITSELDWEKAEYHLNLMIDGYKSIGQCGI